MYRLDLVRSLSERDVAKIKNNILHFEKSSV